MHSDSRLNPLHSGLLTDLRNFFGSISGYNLMIQVRTHPVHTSRAETRVEIWAVRNANIHAGFDKVFRAFGHCAVVADAYRTVLAFVGTFRIGKVGVVNEFFELPEITSKLQHI